MGECGAHEWERAEALLGERHVTQERGDERLEEERERALRVVSAKREAKQR